MEKVKVDVSSLFTEAKEKGTFLNVCAPMVRYSKLQFRELVRRHGVNLCYTPMILADSFCQSSKARSSEFSTSTTDSPLIVQLAAKTAHDFVGAAQLVYPYTDGVDLNCGCPQRWAMKDGYGCSLLNEPETIHNLIRTFKNHLPENFSVSVKIRLLKELKQTIELCQNLESCGINFITIHGRKSWQKNSDPVDRLALKEIKNYIKIPLIANGNIKTWQDARAMHNETMCDGVMSAQGILNNPALFNGESKTPLKCIQDWLNIRDKYKDSISFQCFHHHLVFMLDKILTKSQKRIFNYLTSFDDVHSFLFETFGIKTESELSLPNEEIICYYDTSSFSELRKMYDKDVIYDEPSNDLYVNGYNSNLTDGKYFKATLSKEFCDLDNMESSIFDEYNK